MAVILTLVGVMACEDATYVFGVTTFSEEERGQLRDKNTFYNWPRVGGAVGGIEYSLLVCRDDLFGWESAETR